MHPFGSHCSRVCPSYPARCRFVALSGALRRRRLVVLILNAFEELLVSSLDELAGSALALCFMAEPAFLIVEVLVTLSAFHFTPQEDTHDGTYGCPVLNALQNRIELGRRWQGGATLSEGETVDSDNITFWNKALSDSEVSGLVIPEPTTATLSLLALAGLAARRRRK